MDLKQSSTVHDHTPTPSTMADCTQETALVAEAVTFTGDGNVSVRELVLNAVGEDDLLVDVLWSGVSTGTERLLWSGEMPPFPGLVYPLVPGYEAVGIVAEAPSDPARIGEAVFVPGAHCFKDVSGLFGASAARLVVPAQRAVALAGEAKTEDILLALAATAHHGVIKAGLPELIIGHGTLGRLMARIVLALGASDVAVWETDAGRTDASGYTVTHPDADTRKDYKTICDASGSIEALDHAIMHTARGGEIVLAGFYAERLSFNFPPAFMRELTFVIAAEWTPADMDAVQALRAKGLLSFEGLVTHIRDSGDAQAAYTTAFTESNCLKMVLDWRRHHDYTY